MSEKEKRKRNRVNYNIQAQLITEEHKLLSLQVQNISMDGLYLITNDILPVGTKGEICIVLEFGESRMEVKAECLIVRAVSQENEIQENEIDEPGMGIRFTSIEPESSITLYNMVKHQTPEIENDN